MKQGVTVLIAFFISLATVFAHGSCGGPITYCAPTTTGALQIPGPPIVSAVGPYTGAGVMFRTPWSNAIAMRVTDGETNSEITSYGLFYGEQSNPAVRSPMLGARASQNCNHGSPTCYYIRVIGTGASPKLLWMDGGAEPLGGNWAVGQLCSDNPNYIKTNGYIIGPAYDYGSDVGGVWHSAKFLQTPGSEGILIDVELRTAAGQRNGGVRGDHAWLVARDLTTCSPTADVPETPAVDLSLAYPAFDHSHTKETQGYGPAFNEAYASAVSTSGAVRLTGGVYCVTLNSTPGNDSTGTSAVCYDAGTGQGRWYDALRETAGGGWGQSGPIEQSCIGLIKCKPDTPRMVNLSMTNGPNPYLLIAQGKRVFWDTFGLEQNAIAAGNGTAEGIEITISGASRGQSNLFVSRAVSSPGTAQPVNSPFPKGWASPSSNFKYHIVFPGPLYTHSDSGVAFISTSDASQSGTCIHKVGGTCGIYGLALDGSGTEYSFFPHFSSGAVGVGDDAQKANFAAYIDAAGFTWVYWGSDWMGNVGCLDGVTLINCAAAGSANRTDIFAAVVQ